MQTMNCCRMYDINNLNNSIRCENFKTNGAAQLTKLSMINNKRKHNSRLMKSLLFKRGIVLIHIPEISNKIP